MTIKMLSDAVVITSAIQKTDLKKLQANEPQACILKDADKKEIFVMSFASAGRGGINNNGISFDTTDDAGNASVVIVMTGSGQDTSEKRKAEFVSKFYRGIALIDQLETQVVAAVASHTATIAGLNASIEVLG